MLKQERQAYICSALSLSHNDYHPTTPIYAHAQKKGIARKAAFIPGGEAIARASTLRPASL